MIQAALRHSSSPLWRQLRVSSSSIILTNRTMSSSSTNTDDSPFVKHIVMFRLKEDSPDDTLPKVCQGLLDLPAQIPAIASYELGQDLLLPSGQTHPAGKNRQIVWTVYFQSVDDYNTYDQCAAHQDFLANILKPQLEPGSRAAIQYQVPSLPNNETN